tara:strand:+ start:52 stop:171 length:120 start_codon:yes stop_codon:yes gene_type:complete
MEILIWIFTIPEKIFFFVFNTAIWIGIGYLIADEIRKRL